MATSIIRQELPWSTNGPWFGLHRDSDRTVMVARKSRLGDMIACLGKEWYMMFRYTEPLVRWVVCMKKGIEEPVESAMANKPDITNLHAIIPVRARVP
jgi:hypothetical protein